MLIEYFEILRFLSAFITGALISQSGSLTQVSTGNSLAGPATLGFTGLGVLAVMLSSGSINMSLVYFGLFVFIVLFILKNFLFKTSQNGNQILLIGLCFNLFIGAIFSFVQFLLIGLGVEFPVMIWFGSFKQIEPYYFMLFLFLATTLVGTTIFNAKKFSLLILGSEIAEAYQIRYGTLKKKALLLSLLMTGLVVCYFGVFSFLGLIFPHLLRRSNFFRKDAVHELGIGALLAGFSMMILDMVCYYVPIQGVELPVGMISSVLGSFLLMFLLIKKSFRS